MANRIEDLIPLILVQGALAFRNMSVTANLVNRGYDFEFRKKGDAINIPVYGGLAVQNVVSGRGNENTPSDVEADNVTVQLTEWKEVVFKLDDKEMKSIEDGRSSEVLTIAMQTLADYVDTWTANKLYIGGYSTAGTAGTAFTDPTVLVDGRTKLGTENVPNRDRRVLINPTVAGAFIKDDNMSDSSKYGGSEVLRDAILGKLYGFDVFETNNLTNFVGGTLSDGSAKEALVSADVEAGLKAIVFDETTLTGTLLIGDIFTLAGDTQEYVVTANATASSNAITVAFEPALKIATTDGVAVSFVADQTTGGIAFHKDAFVFGTAPVQIDFSGGNIVESFTDPVSGLTFTLEVERVGKSTEWSMSILYGGEMLKPSGVARLLS